MSLIRIFDFARQFPDGVGAEEPSIQIDVWRFGIPFLSRHSLGIEDCPYWPAAVCLSVASEIAIGAEASGEKGVGIVHLVPESLPHLVHQDQILKTANGKSGT